MDQKFLKLAQEQGWVIEAVEEGSCIVRCPEAGCGMRARIRSSGSVPPRINDRVQMDFRATTFDAARRFLRERREDLRLNIAEVEDAAGLTKDHLAKIERDDSDKVPNLETFVIWANTLGFDVVLRPAELPPVTMRMICDTRSLTGRRGRRFQNERDRRRKAGGRDPR
ncbi:helix-turn-helix domain-containing protein [Pseudooceanicola sp. CBS1P-1]|uniref:Helix-turn-helix domain-containing protein n=1 Tax=Pseudooceanicola albus TaxID=2692189 RepID=A0A6L7G6S9_9RHOB|nr:MULTISPECIES: helix-turn-helix transcriptional regulator [Pseudooceanicola]MBT9385492.1 helix-turn-helix domain-containing protein [Pseudooceanicola endophyticus]MXN19096.1 helix-turn-helix domain-containing protein [Pseudooceanicola albus]